MAATSTDVRTASVRRRAVLVAGLALGLTARIEAATAPASVEVWKSPDCGCCKAWVTHLEKNGFVVRVHNDGNSDARKSLRMPVELGSCHTALIDGYAVEGHVPASSIRRLLRERPKAIGIAVPAMPLGSPGMDGPEYGGRTQPYDVLLVLHAGGTRIYQSYR